MSWAFLLWIAAAQTPADGPGSHLRLGVPAVGSLHRGDPALLQGCPGRRFSWASDEDRKVTVTLESLDYDPYLWVEDENGDPVAMDDNGGVETNARLVFDARRGARYRVLALGPKNGAGGEFTLLLRPGSIPRPAGAEYADAAIAFHAASAERALARGDLKAALEHRFKEGQRRHQRGELSKAAAAFEETAVLADWLGDRDSEAAAWGSLGIVWDDLGDFARSRDFAEKVLALKRSLRDRGGEAVELGNIGNAWRRQGVPSKALEYYKKCLSLLHELKDGPKEAVVLNNAGLAYCSLRDTARAREHFERALDLARRFQNRSLETRVLSSLGNLEILLGNFAEGGRHLEASLDGARELGDRGTLHARYRCSRGARRPEPPPRGGDLEPGRAPVPRLRGPRELRGRGFPGTIR